MDAVGQRAELERRGERAASVAEPPAGASLTDEAPAIVALIATWRVPIATVARPFVMVTCSLCAGRPRSLRSERR